MALNGERNLVKKGNGGKGRGKKGKLGRLVFVGFVFSWCFFVLRASPCQCKIKTDIFVSRAVLDYSRN